MAKACANHPERPGTAECRQCRKPVCAACVVVTAQGSWCSAECGVVHRALQTKPKEDPLMRRAGWAGKLIAIFSLLLLVLLGVHAAAARGVKPAKAIDILGQLFEGLDMLKKKGTPR
ncbi:MAG TPA: B-box zinc finger protein [Planctomycetota bacterium]